MSNRSLRDFFFKRGRSGVFGIVLSLLVLLALSKAAEFFAMRHLEGNWETIVEEEGAEYLQRVEEDFIGLQRVTRRTATEIAQHPLVLQNLRTSTPDQTALIEYLADVTAGQRIGAEIYNAQGSLLAWESLSGPSHQREVAAALSGRLSSYVTRTPVYSQLFVSTPVRDQGRIIGAVLVRRIIEVNYPLDNRFIKREGIADELSKELGVTVELNFSENAEPRKDGRFISAPLYGIDSIKIGIASVSRPARTAYLEGVASIFSRINAAVLTVLVLVVVAAGSLRWAKVHSLLLRCFGITALIWLARYALLWLDIPSMFITSGVFDPASFASKFGHGIAKSIGELAITSVALLLSVLAVTKAILDSIHGQSPWWYPRNIVVRIVLALGSAALVVMLLRGFAATVRSAVFDSTLSYSDPRIIVPSPELGLMVFNLFAIGFCLILVVIGLTSFIRSLLSLGQRERRPLSWLLATALLVAGAVLHGVLQENALTSTLYRILFAIGVIGLTYHLHRRVRLGLPLAAPANFLLALGLSAMMFYPLLDDKVHEKDRSRLEVFAAEFLRPVDSWLTFIVDEALQSFASDETLDILTGDDTEKTERLAFLRWAQSSICREGYSCAFVVFDSTMHEISRFVLGGQAVLLPPIDSVRTQAGTKNIRVEEVGTGVNTSKVYRGITPIISIEGRVVAQAVVVVAAGQQTMFRGDTPSILRSLSKESLESFYRPVQLSEFRGGVLFASNNSSLPLGYQLSERVRVAFTELNRVSFWNEEAIDGIGYETYYVRRSPGSDAVVGLSIRQTDMTWHLVGAVKVLVYYSIVVLLVLLGFFLYEWRGRRRYEFKFRDKLLIALLITAIVPMTMIGTIGRLLARERLMENAANRLEQETATVGLNVLQRVSVSDSGSTLLLSPSVVEQLASDYATDFNIYVGNELQTSSRPELYEAGILDRRMSGSAYANINIKKRRFFLQTETLGLYRYAVGYRPLVASNGDILGVVSVPTLFRQDELDEEVAKQNALIFGVYAFVLFAILIIATTLANRIAAPVHRLTEATKRVARGDLDVSISSATTDGEIGELIKAFESMTRELKRSRGELVKVERELAWKEMAKQVAHEIKNPLTPMKLSLQHLRQTYKDKVPDLDRVFEEVSRTLIEQIDALGRIASEFSHFARMPKRQLEPCDVNAILLESMRLFEQDRNVRFEMSAAEHLPLLMADREELRRAFINIIRNGIQAMDDGGEISIATRMDASHILVSIKDSGGGISEDLKQKLFQPNFSTKTDGMGLGLAIVKKTVDDLNGTVEIESEKGKGTTVTFRFPTAQEDLVA